jgi:hypothetical protein
MTYFIAFGIIFLLAVIVLQIGKLSELATKIRGEEDQIMILKVKRFLFLW